jgi:hypothetical protein
MNISNYPPGVTVQDFNELYEYKIAEISLSGLEYDNGYGIQCADLTSDVEQLTNGDIVVLGSTYFLIDQDGGCFKEITVKDPSDLEQGHLELIINKANEEFLK